MAKVKSSSDKILSLLGRIRAWHAYSWLTLYDAAFLCLLIYSVFIRLVWLAPPYLNGDSQRDYLASHHIIAYQDYPLLGPWNTFFGMIASPVYFYFLALLLLIKDNILTLQYINVVLQMATLAIFYMFTKKIFSARTALIAMALFMFSRTVFLQTKDFWQPSIMMPFLALSYLLLLWAYTKKSYRLLLGGLFVFTFAGIIHNSATILFPPFLIVALLILKMRHAKIKQYMGALLSIVVPFILAHTPVFIYFWEQHERNGSFLLSMKEKLSLSFSQFIVNFIQAIRFFITLFFRHADSGQLLPSVVLVIGIAIAGCMYFFNRRKTPFQKTCAGLMSAAMLFPILGVSFFTISLTDRYFVPVFGILLILITEYISSLFSKNKLSVAFGIILSFFLIANFSFAPSIFTPPNQRVVRENPLAQDIALIANTVTDIQRKEQRQDSHFFQVALYSYSNQFAWFPAELWNGIEKKFDKQFTVYDGFRRSPRDYMSLNTGDYMFVVCNSQFTDIDEKICLSGFSQENHGYSLVKEMPTRYSTLYLMKNGR